MASAAADDVAQVVGATPAYHGLRATKDAHRQATLTPERIAAEEALSIADARAEEARGGAPAAAAAVTPRGAQKQQPRAQVPELSDTESDDGDNNGGRGWAARPRRGGYRVALYVLLQSRW